MPVREIVVIGIDGGAGVAEIARILSSMTLHSVMVEADVRPDRIPSPGGEVRMGTRFHQERRVARLLERLCSACGRCARACAPGAISFGDGLVVDTDRCTGCGKCIDACPREALTLSVMTDACIHASAARHGRLVHAELAQNGRTSAGLVFALREEGRRQAKMMGSDAIWIDASLRREDLLKVALAGAHAALVVVADEGVRPDGMGVDILEIVREAGVSADLLILGDAVFQSEEAFAEGDGGRIFRVSESVSPSSLAEVHGALLPTCESGSSR